MAASAVESQQAGYDPAQLAFIKCHLTSFTRWDALRALAERSGRWSSPGDLARAAHRPVPAVSLALEGLRREGLIRRRSRAGEPTYRLSPSDPTSRLVARLVEDARQSQDLRRLIVARVLATDRGERQAAVRISGCSSTTSYPG